MNVANASFSQMPFHQSIVTRLPNHMWASSWATTSTMRSSSAVVAFCGSASSSVSRKVMAPHVLHRAEGKVRHGDEVHLAARVVDAVVIHEPCQRERSGFQAEARQGRLAPHMHNAQRHAAHVDGIGGLEVADNEGHEVGGHLHGVGEGVAPAAVRQGFLTTRTSPQLTAMRPAGHDHRDAEDRLEVRLVEARKCPPGVRGLELGRRNGVGLARFVNERGPVEAPELVASARRRMCMRSGGRRVRAGCPSAGRSSIRSVSGSNEISAPTVLSPWRRVASVHSSSAAFSMMLSTGACTVAEITTSPTKRASSMWGSMTMS